MKFLSESTKKESHSFIIGIETHKILYFLMKHLLNPRLSQMYRKKIPTNLILTNEMYINKSIKFNVFQKDKV